MRYDFLASNLNLYNFLFVLQPQTTTPVAKIDYDHIEVSLEENDDSEEILTRAKDFFLEYNDNFTMNWKDAVELDRNLDSDPSKPPEPGKLW